MGFKGDPVRLLVIPGLNDSGPAHWQSWLQGHFSRHAVRVGQDDWASADLARWAQRIEATLTRHPRSHWVAVAHSFGCLALLRHLALGGEDSQARRPLRVLRISIDDLIRSSIAEASLAWLRTVA